MNGGEKNNQLVKIAVIVNVLFFLLCISLVLFLGFNHSEDHHYLRKITAFAIANMICWVVNVCIVVFLLPKLFKGKQNKGVFFYFLSYLINLIVIQLLSGFVIKELELKTVHTPLSPLFYAIVFNTISLISIELIISRQEKSHIMLENVELKMMSLQAQHEKLKNQLHPHFLFNSLNALKSLIRKDPVLAESYLIKLSEFLRFSISHNEQNIVPLQEELKFSLYYLEMQKIRFRDSLSYQIDMSLNTMKDVVVPVFSLQLLIENAIKHNALTNEKPLCIQIHYVAPDRLLVENNLSVKLNIEPGSGFGLKNLSDRYKLLGNEDIEIKSNSNNFQVYIKLLSA